MTSSKTTPHPLLSTLSMSVPAIFCRLIECLATRRAGGRTSWTCVFSRKRAMGSMKHHRTRERGAGAPRPSFPLLNGTLWIVRGALKEGAGGERGRDRGREGKSPMLKRKSVSIGCQKPTLPPLHYTPLEPSFVH